jgi:hypothetical protein
MKVAHPVWEIMDPSELDCYTCIQAPRKHRCRVRTTSAGLINVPDKKTPGRNTLCRQKARWLFDQKMEKILTKTVTYSSHNVQYPFPPKIKEEYYA